MPLIIIQKDIGEKIIIPPPNNNLLEDDNNPGH